MSEDERAALQLAEQLLPAQRLGTSVEAFAAPLADFLREASLPTEDVFVALEERRAVLDQLRSAISVLPEDRRLDAHYLSKFTVAVSIGLFDAALNYLWNETVASIRRLVAKTDLEYFFDVVEKREEVRKKLRSEDDLPQIGEAQLLEGAHNVGLLTSVNYHRLKHINYMRNHASAAHPNQNDLNGPEMAGWLSNCLRYAITAEPSRDVVTVNRLLARVRSDTVDPADVSVIVDSVERLPPKRINDLAWTLFGLYCDPRQSQQARDNIDLLSGVWLAASEDRRYEIGGRYADFVRHAENDRKALAHQFLTNVDGLRYRSEDVLEAELLDALRTLRTVHHSGVNFSSERNHARALGSSLPQNGQVPVRVRRDWVYVITQCWIGNGLGYYGGVDTIAEPYYWAHIEAFGEEEAAAFVQLFVDADFVQDMGRRVAHGRAVRLAEYLKTKTQHVHLLAALDAIATSGEMALPNLGKTSAFKRTLQSVPAP